LIQVTVYDAQRGQKYSKALGMSYSGN